MPPERRDGPRLALFLPDLGGGGAERVLVDIANASAARGIATDLVLAAPRGPYLEEVGSDVRIVGLGDGGVVRALPALVRYLRRERPDALLASLMHASTVAIVAGRLAGGATRVFVREANTVSQVLASGLRTRVLKRLVRVLYPLADGVVAVSEGVATDLRALGVPARKVRTIYNPVVHEGLLRRAEETPDHPWLARRGDGPVLLAVGSLRPQKDFGTLLRAFARLRERLPARLVILGEGDGREELEHLVRELGLEPYVDLPGFVANPFACMARADLFVLSSRYEGLPNVLIQAIACGCPVVSTDCPSGPREILDDGRYGPLVPVGDVSALAGAMERTLLAPPAAEALRERSALFDRERNVERYLELLLGGEGRASTAVPASRAASR